MSPQTVCPAPTDRSMWRRLLARTHPDRGGAEDLFIWTHALREHVAGDDVESPPRESPPRSSSPDDVDRVPFPAGADFASLTRRALALEVEELFGALLWLLEDCEPSAI